MVSCMHNFKKIISNSLIVCTFTIIILIGLILPYFYGEAYYYQDYNVRKSLSGTLDTLIIGSSHALRSIKPTVLNSELGVHSYNLSSPLMSMAGRYYLFKKEAERNPIDTLYIELSYNALTLDRESLGMEGDLYVLGRFDNFAERAEFFSDAFDIHEWGAVFEDTILRAQNSLSGSLHPEMAQYDTFGYLPATSGDFYLSSGDKKDILDKEQLDVVIKEENLKYLNKIIEYCNDNNIKIAFVVVPIAEKALLRYSNIDEVFSQYIEIARQNNCDYYDLNLDKKRLKLYSEHSSFYDDTHMSDSGADIFSKRLSDLIKNNKSVQSNPEGYFESYRSLKRAIMEQSV